MSSVARGLVRSIRRLYAPVEAAIVIFAEEYLCGLKEFCDANGVELHYSHQIAQWALPLIYDNKEYRNDKSHYYHPDFIPDPSFPCDVARSSVGFERIRHLHSINVKAYCTAYCLNVRQFEWVVHIDADAFLLGKIDDLLAEMKPNTVIGFDDRADELPNLEGTVWSSEARRLQPHTLWVQRGCDVLPKRRGSKKAYARFHAFHRKLPSLYLLGMLCGSGRAASACREAPHPETHQLRAQGCHELEPDMGARRSSAIPRRDWRMDQRAERQAAADLARAGLKKLWTSQYELASVKRAWQSVGGEILTRRWIEVAGSLIEENCLVMCELIRRYNPSSTNLRILEFGTQYGRTAIAMCCVLAERGVSVHVNTCDIFAPSSDYPVGFPRQKVVLQNIAAFGLTGQIVSHHVAANENLVRRFEGQLYDVVFIDANHQFKQVLADCVIAQHLVKKGGLIIGDDWQVPDVRDASRLVFGPDQPSLLGRNMWFTVHSP